MQRLSPLESDCTYARPHWISVQSRCDLLSSCTKPSWRASLKGVADVGRQGAPAPRCCAYLQPTPRRDHGPNRSQSSDSQYRLCQYHVLLRFLSFFVAWSRGIDHAANSHRPIVKSGYDRIFRNLLDDATELREQAWAILSPELFIFSPTIPKGRKSNPSDSHLSVLEGNSYSHSQKEATLQKMETPQI
jgi:hypothetical protein